MGHLMMFGITLEMNNDLTWIIIFALDFIINMIFEIIIDAIVYIWIGHIGIQILLQHIGIIVD